MKAFLRLLPVALVFVLLFGCGSQVEEVVDDTPKVVFEGKPDARFVGTWTSEDGKSTYTLKEDGAYNLKAKISTPGGAMDTESAGSWAVNGDRFLIKDPAGNVVPYTFDFADGKLTLGLTGSMKTSTVLVKAP